MADISKPDFDVLRQVFSYDAETGGLFWRHRPAELFLNDMGFKTWNGRHAGKPALISVDRGYLKGNLFGRTVYAHRIIWALVHSEWAEEIDHINGNRGDNRLINLRNVDRTNNGRNLAKNTKNTSGVVGVSFHRRRGKWLAEIGNGTKNGEKLGFFADKQDAINARKAAEIALQYHANHGR